MTTTPQAGHYTVLKGELVWVGPTREEALALRRALDAIDTALQGPDSLDRVRQIVRQYRAFLTPVATRSEP